MQKFGVKKEAVKMPRCSNCGWENKEEARFCGNCGAPLVQESGKEQGGRSKKGHKKMLLILIVAIILLAILGTVVYVFWSDRREKQFDASLEQGQKYLEEQEYEKAIACFDEAISIEAKEIKPYAGLAKAYAETGDWGQAQTAYQNMTTVVKEIYNQEQEIPDEAKEGYKDAMQFYGEDGNTTMVENLADEVTSMMNDEEEKAEMEKAAAEACYANVLKEYGTADSEIEGTYRSVTVRGGGRSSADTEYTLAEGSDIGLIWHQIGDYDEDGTYELVAVWIEQYENDNILLAVSEHQDYYGGGYTQRFTLIPDKNARYTIQIQGRYLVIAEQKEESGGFYSGIHFPVFRSEDDYDRSHNESYTDTIYVSDLADSHEEVLTLKRNIRPSNTELVVCTIESADYQAGFFKGYSRYTWEDGREVLTSEEEFYSKALSLLSELQISGIGFSQLTWDGRWDSLKVNEDQAVQDFCRMEYAASEGQITSETTQEAVVEGTLTIKTEIGTP